MHDDKQNTPETKLPATTEEWLDLLEQFKQRIEHLEQRMEHLKGVNADLRSQLSAALASNHTPLLRFGAGTATCILSARFIKALSLAQGVTLSHPPMPSGRWQVMVDDLPVSEYLEPEAALAKLRLVEKQWIDALEPPE